MTGKGTLSPLENITAKQCQKMETWAPGQSPLEMKHNKQRTRKTRKKPDRYDITLSICSSCT